jgi:cell pole-organizing protein PopZ
MAMGEIREYKPEDSDLPSTIHNIAARIRAVQQQQQQSGRKAAPGQEEPEQQQQDQKYRPIYFLQTRILRNANGTNMKLHTEALYARRQQLVAARSRQPADQDTSASCALWPGCGPPPYNSKNDSKV